MHLYRLSTLVSVLIGGLVLIGGAVQAQDTEIARKKCVEFGFQEKTTAHESCVKQFLQSTGAGKVPGKPVPVAPPSLTAMQLEEKFWDGAMVTGNREAFEAYLENYPKGRYAGLARANVKRLTGSADAQQQAVAEAERKLATDRTAFEAEQRAATERVAKEAAQRLAAAETVKRESVKVSPGQIIKDCANCPEMVMIPAGSFEMGSNESSDERPIHRVNLPAFLLGRTEVTQGQWQAVMGSNPSHFKQCGTDCPVENISWNDAQEFARRLTAITGKTYRLPSESEWEYAARAGSRGKWYFGGDESQLGEYAWFSTNSGAMTHPVAQKKPNAFGLYDMHGNALEWVQDVYHESYQSATADGSAWISGGGDMARRVLRSGAWNYRPGILRSADRFSFARDHRFYDAGLRIARSL